MSKSGNAVGQARREIRRKEGTDGMYENHQHNNMKNAIGEDEVECPGRERQEDGIERREVIEGRESSFNLPRSWIALVLPPHLPLLQSSPHHHHHLPMSKTV